MHHRHPFSCFLVGEGTLPIRCAEVLLERGVKINGMISSDPAIGRWAKEKEMPSIDPREDLVGFMEREPCDYLFSIVNGHVLPKEVLALPRCYAVNYHNALLPKYAGSHATSWAIMNRERAHGITWHVMSERVDAGDILKQRPVEIADGETALTLNAKCYEAALRAFVELADDLCHSRASRTKQNPDDRTFFARHKRPPAGCVLSWNRCAYEIDAFVRALDFAPYPNPMGLPKLAIGKDFVGVCRTEVLESAAHAPAGTIMGIDGGSIRVATTTREIALRKLVTIEGRPLSISDAVEKFALREGYRFSDLETETAARLSELNASICKQETFWIERLSTLRPFVPPYGFRKTSQSPGRRASAPVRLPQELTDYAANPRQSSDASDLLLAAFAVYLTRLGGGARFDIGYTHTGLLRELSGLENLFATEVPLPLEIDVTKGFAAALRKVGEQIESTQRRKTYARDTVARYPALHSIVESRTRHALPVGVARVARVDDYEPPLENELTLVISQDGTECRWVYNSAVLDPARVDTMLSQFTILLRALAAEPERCVAELPLMSDEELHRVLVSFNDTSARFFPNDGPIHRLLEMQAERSPEAVAVALDGDQWSYRELNRRANQLARHLRSAGVGPDALVGICIERSLEMVVGVLGVLKAGAAYVPLDPDYPRERLIFMLQDSKATVLLTQRQLIQRLQPSTVSHEPFDLPVAKVICLDSGWDAIAQQSDENIGIDTMPESLAYVIYTSGSTGRPKGVMVPHRAVSNRLLWGQTVYPLTARDRVLQLASFSFDFSVWEIFAPLLAGARLVLPPPGQHLDIAKITNLIGEQAITTAHFTPSGLEAFLEQDRVKQCSSLRNLFSGGEALPVKLLERFFSRFDVRLYNQYGPTEACIDSTFWACVPETPQSSVPIGRPIANTQIYLLDTHLQPVPLGVTGEIYIGGAGLARGYLNRPDITAEQFAPDPFSRKPGARLYKTGDLARYFSDGKIEFVGRVDHQVKIRGFRIELGEIEAALSRHPAVYEAVIVAQEDPSTALGTGKRLVAYIVSQGNRAPSVTELRGFLKQKLPDYMVPHGFVYVDALPLTPGGKTDRRALPAPDRLRPQLSESYAPPKSELERSLVRLWQEALAIENVGVHDNFFDLGGHSLLVVRIQPKLQEILSREISVVDLFRYPTISALIGGLNQADDERARFQNIDRRAERQREALARKKATYGRTKAPGIVQRT